MTTEKRNELLKYLSDDETRKMAGENLLNNYNTAIDNLEKSKRSQQQGADIALQKMQKYLPQHLKAQGLHGLGISETAQIDAQNQYVSQLGRIAQAHDTQRATLDNDFNKQLLSLYEAHKTEKETERQNAYNIAVDTINSWSGSSDELKKYMNTLGTELGVESKEYKAIENLFNGYIGEIEKEEKAKTEQETIKKSMYTLKNAEVPDWDNDGAGDGDWLTVKYEGKDYNLELSAEVQDQNIVNAAADLGQKQVFEYQGKLYMKADGKVFGLQNNFLGGFAEDYDSLLSKVKDLAQAKNAQKDATEDSSAPASSTESGMKFDF